MVIDRIKQGFAALPEWANVLLFGACMAGITYTFTLPGSREMASQSYTAQGRIIHIGETQQITDTFKKREFVIEIPDGNYPQEVKFQLAKDHTTKLDGLAVGTEVVVSFNLRGKAYTRKDGTQDWFNNMDAWRIETLANGQPSLDTLETHDDVPF